MRRAFFGRPRAGRRARRSPRLGAHRLLEFGKEFETLGMLRVHRAIRAGPRTTTEAEDHEASLAWRDDLRRGRLARRLSHLSGRALVPGVRRVLHVRRLRSRSVVHSQGWCIACPTSTPRRDSRLRHLPARVPCARSPAASLSVWPPGSQPDASIVEDASTQRPPPSRMTRGRGSDAAPPDAARAAPSGSDAGISCNARLAVRRRRQQVHRRPVHARRASSARTATQCVAAGESCVDGVCLPTCSASAAPCPTGYACDFNRDVCLVNPSVCSSIGAVPGRRGLRRDAVRGPLRVGRGRPAVPDRPGLRQRRVHSGPAGAVHLPERGTSERSPARAILAASACTATAIRPATRTAAAAPPGRGVQIGDDPEGARTASAGRRRPSAASATRPWATSATRRRASCIDGYCRVGAAARARQFCSRLVLRDRRDRRRRRRHDSA